MKRIYVGIFLLIICIGLVIYNEISLSKYDTNIHDITNNATKTEGVKVYLNATLIGGGIRINDNDGYYMVFGDDVQYIVYMSNNKANKINNYLLNHPLDSYKIIGITKLIPEELEDSGKKFVSTWLDVNHKHDRDDEPDSHNITTDDFYHYFGYVYLDNTVNNNLLIKIIICLTGITGVLIIISFVFRKYFI